MMRFALFLTSQMLSIKISIKMATSLVFFISYTINFISYRFFSRYNCFHTMKWSLQKTHARHSAPSSLFLPFRFLHFASLLLLLLLLRFRLFRVGRAPVRNTVTLRVAVRPTTLRITAVRRVRALLPGTTTTTRTTITTLSVDLFPIIFRLISRGRHDRRWLRSKCHKFPFAVVRLGSRLVFHLFRTFFEIFRDSRPTPRT